MYCFYGYDLILSQNEYVDMENAIFPKVKQKIMGKSKISTIAPIFARNTRTVNSTSDHTLGLCTALILKVLALISTCKCTTRRAVDRT
jgi:hypothetical protein